MNRKMLLLRDGRRAVVRLLSRNDTELLCCCFAGFGKDARRNFAPHPFSREMADEICCHLRADKTSLRFLVTIGHPPHEKPIGYAFVRMLDRKVPALAIGLIDEVTGQGLGRQVLAFLLDIARATGFAKIALTVMMRNHRARAFYEQNGFSYHGTRFWDACGKGWSLKMEKSLRDRKNGTIWTDSNNHT